MNPLTSSEGDTDPHKPAAKEIKQLRNAGQISESIAYGEAYLKGHPNAVRVLCSTAASYIAIGRPKDAEARYKAAMEKFPGDAVAHNGYAQAALIDGRPKDAEARYKAAMEKFPGDAVAHSGYAQAALIDGRPKDAEARYKTAMEKFPDNVVAHNGYAQAALIDGRPKDAEARYKTAMEKFPDGAVAHSGYAQAALIDGRPKDAEARYKTAMEKFPGDAVAHSGYAQAALIDGRPKDAEARYKTAMEKFPGGAVAHNGYAQAALIDGRPKDAEARYKTAMEKFPDSVVAHNGYAQALIKQDKYSEAGGILLAQRKTHPGDEMASVLLAAVGAKTKNIALMTSAFGAIAQFPPTAARLGLLKDLARMGVEASMYNILLFVAERDGLLSEGEVRNLRLPDKENMPGNGMHDRVIDVEGPRFTERAFVYAQSRIFATLIPLEPINRVAFRVARNYTAPVERQ